MGTVGVWPGWLMDTLEAPEQHSMLGFGCLSSVGLWVSPRLYMIQALFGYSYGIEHSLSVQVFFLYFIIGMRLRFT